MAKSPQCNGSGKFDIGAHDMGGWVRIIPGKSADMLPDLPGFLAHRLSEWLREHPHLRLLCVVPISRDGATVELQAWSEQHSFPDKSAAQQR
jgi:hypothetical protein